MNAELIAQSGHRPSVASVAFAPDGRTLASIERHTSLKLWDVTTGECRRTLPASSQMPLLFTPDGQHLVTSWRGGVQLWDVASGAQAGGLAVQNSRLSHGVTCAAFSPDGRWFAVSGWNRVYVWRYAEVAPLFAASPANAEDYAAYPPFPAPIYTFVHVGQALALLFLMDNNTLIVGRGDYGAEYDGRFESTANPAGIGILDFYDLTTGQRQETFTEMRLWPGCLAASPDGRLIAAPQRSSWASLGGTPCALSPVALANSNWDGGIWLLGLRAADDASQAYSQILRGPAEKINALAFSPDSRTLVSSGDDDTLRLWDTITGACTRMLRQAVNPHLTGQARGIKTVAYSPDGARLASGAEDGVVKIWDAQTGAALHTSTMQLATIRDFALSPDGRRMACSVADARWDDMRGQWLGGLHCWNLATGEYWHQEQCDIEYGYSAGSSRQHLLFSPNSETLAVIEERYKHKDVRVTLWDAGWGVKRWTLEGVAQYTQFAFSADSLRLTGTIGAESWEWDVTDSTLLRSARFRSAFDDTPDHNAQDQLQREANDVVMENIAVGAARALSPDGLASLCVTYNRTNKIGEAALVDVWTGTMLRRLAQTRHGFNNCQFLADGSSVVLEILMQPHSQNEDTADEGTAVWNLQTGVKEAVLAEAHRITPVAASPDSRWIAAPGEDGKVWLWERRASAPYLRTLLAPTPHPAYYLAWSADSRILTGLDMRGSVYFWNPSDGSLAATLSLLPSGADWLLATPGGDYDASPGTDAFLRWNVDGVLYPLEHLRHQHHRPGLLQQLLRPSASPQENI